MRGEEGRITNTSEDRTTKKEGACMLPCQLPLNDALSIWMNARGLLCMALHCIATVEVVVFVLHFNLHTLTLLCYTSHCVIQCCAVQT